MNKQTLPDIHCQILGVFFANDTDYCYPYKTFVSTTKLELPVVKAAMQELKALGYVKVYRGLMSEEGEVAGSGFGLVSTKLHEAGENYEAYDHKRALNDLYKKRDGLNILIAEMEKTGTSL